MELSGRFAATSADRSGTAGVDHVAISAPAPSIGLTSFPPTGDASRRTPNSPIVPRPIDSSKDSDRLSVWIVAGAIVALVVKLAIAYNTFGTNDVVTFYSFARALSEHGLEWTYRHGVVWLSSSSLFNHPPLTSYFLRAIYRLDHIEFFRSNGITFPFLLRLPGILADFGVVLLLLNLAKTDARLSGARWAILVFAVSPVSIMVSGFHGNTDPVMVFFLVASVWAAMRNRPSLCGLFFAMSCQVKVAPVLLFPIVMLFWWHRRATIRFLVAAALVFLSLWSEPLLNFPALFIRNVLSYGSYWGIWGITYWFRMTGIAAFSFVWFEGFSPAQRIVVACLKAVIIGSVLCIAWRRRALPARSLTESIGYAWIAFFVFSPGVCAQYMVWLAPFILFLSPAFYLWLTVSSALFLFFFYNVTAHGLPWYLAISTNQLNTIWTPWAVWPWAVLIAGSIVLYRQVARKSRDLANVEPSLIGT